MPTHDINITASFVQDGDTLATGLTFPANGLKIKESGGGSDVLTLRLDEVLSNNRALNIQVSDGDRTVNVTGDAELEGTNTGDQDLSPYQTIAALAADVRAVVLTGISFATSTAITAADSILVAFGKLQAFNNLFTTVGLAIARLTNPSAVTFLRMNADNTATARTASEMLTDIGILRTSLTSAFVTNSASFVDVTGMALTVPAGKTAKFTFYVPYSSATTTVGIGLSMTVTGSPLVRHFTRFTPTNATGTPVRAMINTDDAGAVNASTGSASTTYGIEMNGVVVADASPCVVQLRVAVGGTPANITLSAGSVMIATLID